MVFCTFSELIGEDIVPDFLHVVPVLDNTLLDGFINLENTSLLQGLISKESFNLLRSHEDTTIRGFTDNCGNDSSWDVLTSETSLHST